MNYERLKKKKAKAHREGDLKQLIYSCNELGGIHFEKEDYDEAIREYREMEGAAEAMNSEIDVAIANRLIGEAFIQKHDCQQAISHSQKFLSIAKKLNDTLEEQRALFTLGRVYLVLAEQFTNERDSQRIDAILKSKQYFLDSLAVVDQLSDKLLGSKERSSMKARSFLNMGITCDVEGNVSSAIEYLQQAVAICKKNDLWEDLYMVYNALGTAYRKDGNYKEAISIFDKNIPVAEKLSSKIDSLCEVLLHKAEALLGLPDFRGARQCLLKSYKLKNPRVSIQNEIEGKLRIVAAMCEVEVKLTDLAPEGHEEERKKLYEALGDMASDQKAYPVALTYYTLMLQCVEKCGGDGKALKECYVSLAETYKDNKQYKKALEFFKKVVALEKGNHEEACGTYLNIAELYHYMGKDSNAMEAYKTAKLCAEAAKNPKLTKLVLTNLKLHLEVLGDYQEANRIAEEIDTCSDTESSDEDSQESDKKEYGTHINLDELSDPEADIGDIAPVRASRTRPRPKANLDKKKNDLGETPLHRAAIAGNLVLATKLIDQGHSVDVRDNSGWTPLHEAANLGHLDIVELLLKKGAPVNDRGGSGCDGFTPLLDAARNGRFDVMDLLLQHKASPLMKNNSGMTVLELMEEWKNAEEEGIGGSLDQETLKAYNAMYSKLQQILDRAGYKSSHKPVAPLKNRVELRRTTARTSVCEEDDMQISIGMPALHGESFSSSPTRINKWNERRAGAASEYESAMRALRFRNNTDKGHSTLTLEPKQPALISADDFVDDWLEEDIVRPNKKRKTTAFFGEPQRKRRSDERSPSPSPRKPGARFPDSSDDSLDWCSVVEPSTPPRLMTDPNSPSTSGTTSNKLKIMNISRKQELSLSTSKEKIGRTTNEDVSNIMGSPPNVSSNVVCIRVLVEGKLLLVPIPSRNEHLTIDWLAEETAKRYKSLEEVEPKLRLLTTDGAILLNSDPISLVLGMGELQGQVLSWNLPSLVTSYEELCYNNHLSEQKSIASIGQDSSVLAILESCPSTGSADFSGTYLDPRHSMYALKVLSHHHQLQTLNLSGSCVCDSNMKELAGYIVKLTHLRSLNLSNINISSEGLANFSHLVIEHKGLQRLQSLDIGFNPLGDCLKPLGDLVCHLPALTCLLIPSVDLVTQSFRGHLDFTLDTLETINVSYNDIGTDGVIDLLGRLNARCIQQLLLSHTGGKTIREVGLYLQANAPPSLRSLDLSYCPASEDDMHELIHGLEMCPHLEKLVLEGVRGFNIRNVDQLMSCKSVRSLNLAGSPDIIQPLQVVEHLATLAISSCSEQNLPQKGPFGLFASGPLKDAVIKN